MNQKYHRVQTILPLLEKCRTFRELKQLHGLMITTSLIKQIIPLSKLIDFCTNSETSNLDYAESVFLQIDHPSVYIWNSMIRGHSNSNNPNEALFMYREMQQLGYSPDHFTFPFVLKACTTINNHSFGKCVHDRVIKTGFDSDLYASTSLIHMYVSCSDTDSGEKVFAEMPQRNVVAWTTLIAGYVNNDRATDAIRAFKEMEFRNIEPNDITLVNVLVACAQSKDIETGTLIHDRVHQIGSFSIEGNSTSNVILNTAILEMYAKCGSLEKARAIFNEMPERNVVAWNSMMGAYNQYGQAGEALKLFMGIRNSRLNPDETTFLILFSACANMGNLVLGQGLHGYIAKTNIGKDVVVGTSLMGMYAKTGDTQSAVQIFNGLEKKDVMAWTSMIMGMAMHGQSHEALDLFRKMQRDDEVKPDHITYIGVLCACSYAGLVKEGYKHFNSMKNLYGLVPMEEHYCCMVDLLSRAGRLNEAEKLVQKMPMEPNIAIWGALLNGCEIHENIELADRVGNRIMELRPQGSGVYVLLSNIYAKAGNWQGVKMARELMKSKAVERTYGWSSVDVKGLSP